MKKALIIAIAAFAAIAIYHLISHEFFYDHIHKVEQQAEQAGEDAEQKEQDELDKQSDQQVISDDDYADSFDDNQRVFDDRADDAERRAEHDLDANAGIDGESDDSFDSLQTTIAKPGNGTQE